MNKIKKDLVRIGVKITNKSNGYEFKEHKGNKLFIKTMMSMVNRDNK